MAPKTRTNAYPTVKPLQDLFASRPSGVTMIGPDKHVWQSGYHDGLPFHTSDNSGNMPFIKPEGVDPRNYINKYVIGPNQKLLMGYKDAQGQYGWREEKNIMSDNTVGFKLPSTEEVPASLDANAIDDKGIALTLFVGANASYRRADALPVYWDGETFFDLDKNELYVPEQFKRGIPTTYGLKGTVYIPQESYLEDLLIPIEDQEISFPAEYHVKGTYPSISVNLDGRHAVTGRKVGNQNAKECFESAWEQAVFEIEDIFTMPGASYRERRAVLETFVKPLKDAYKQIRLIPMMPIHSREWAMSAYENTPPNAYLVITDPDSVFEGAVNPKEKAPPRKRRNLDQNEFAGPLVGWKLDGSGKLEGVVVEGTSTVNKSAIVVHPGQLWVLDGENKDINTPALVNRKRLDDIKAIRGLNTALVKIPNEFITRMVKAYEADFELQTRSLAQIKQSVALNRARAYRAIRHTIASKLWNIHDNTNKNQLTEYNGVKVDIFMVLAIEDYTVQGIFGDGQFNITATQDELLIQLRLFVTEVCSKADKDTFKAADVLVTGFPASSGKIAYVQLMWAAMTPLEKQALVNGCMELRNTAPVAYGKGRKIAADAKTGFLPHITAEVIRAFLYTDEDPIYPLTEKKLTDKDDVYKATLTGYSPHATDKTKVTIDTEHYLVEAADIFRQLSISIVDRLIQSIKPSDLFVRTHGAGGTGKDAPKNLLEWSTAQTVYFQRSFPYGALIHFKVIKGDAIDEYTKEDDSYAMTKVTVV